MFFKSGDILKVYFFDKAELLGCIAKTVLLYIVKEVCNTN